jgi:hypothetical protein
MRSSPQRASAFASRPELVRFDSQELVRADASLRRSSSEPLRYRCCRPSSVRHAMNRFFRPARGGAARQSRVGGGPTTSIPQTAALRANCWATESVIGPPGLTGIPILPNGPSTPQPEGPVVPADILPGGGLAEDIQCHLHVLHRVKARSRGRGGEARRRQDEIEQRLARWHRRARAAIRDRARSRKERLELSGHRSQRLSPSFPALERLDDMGLEDLGLTRELDARLLQPRPQLLAEGVELLL